MLSKELEKALERHLPVRMAGEMHKFLHKHVELKEQFAKLREDFEKALDELDTCRTELEKAQNQLKRQAEVTKRLKKAQKLEQEVSKREQAIEVELLKLRLEMQEQTHVKMYNLVNRVFGHPSVTVSTVRDEVVPVDGANGCGGYVSREAGLTENVTTTKGKV